MLIKHASTIDIIQTHFYFIFNWKQGAFETSSKKKKNRLAGTTDAAAADGEWNESNNANNNNGDLREKSRNRNNSNARGGRGNSDSRGWRGRESRDTGMVSFYFSIEFHFEKKTFFSNEFQIECE